MKNTTNFKFKYALIDISNLFRRNYEIQNKLLHDSNKDTIYKETIKHSLISINKIEKDLLTNDNTVYFLFDNPTSKQNIRYELSSEYKNNRKKMPDEYYKAIDHLALILQYRDNKSYLIRVPFLEADDSVKPVIEKIRETDKINNIVLCSADFDYARSITKNNYWYNFNEVISYDLFYSNYNFYPTESSVILYKTIMGDDSDCIKKAIHNIQEKLVIGLISNYKDIYGLLADIENTNLSDKWKKEIKLNEKQLRLNYTLIDYIHTDYIEISEYIVKSKLSCNLLKDLYKTITNNIKDIDKRDLVEVVERKKTDSFFDTIKLERL